MIVLSKPPAAIMMALMIVIVDQDGLVMEQVVMVCIRSSSIY